MKLLTNKLLETFCAVVECGGFTDAQYKLGLTQSAISCRIRDLEVILGYRVWERGRRGFYLTERGQIAYDKAQSILRSVRDFDTELLELRQVITGDLRVGLVDAVSSLPELNLSSAIERFYARTDQVRLELIMASPVELTQRLISGSLHIGIAPVSQPCLWSELCWAVLRRTQPVLRANPSIICSTSWNDYCWGFVWLSSMSAHLWPQPNCRLGK